LELTSASGPPRQCRVVYPLFFDDELVGVLEGKYVLGTVARRSLIAVRTERRSSFKHPAVGAAVGLAMTLVPLQSVAGDPLGLWWLTLGSPLRLVGSFFMFGFGALLLWGVWRRREEPWIVFTTKAGESAYPLEYGLSPQARETVQSLCDGAPEAGT
jgi:hypothetical protein